MSVAIHKLGFRPKRNQTLRWDGSKFYWDTLTGADFSGFTATRVPYANTDGSLTDSASLTWNGSTFSVTGGTTVSGQAIFGATTLDADVPASVGTPPFALVAPGATAVQSLVIGTGNTADPAYMWAMKTRSTGTDANTAVQNGDELFELGVEGADGTSFTVAAQIKVFVDGTPGANDMPGRMEFYTTADGAATGTKQMSIDNAGVVTLYDNTASTSPTTGAFVVTGGAGISGSLYGTTGVFNTRGLFGVSSLDADVTGALGNPYLALVGTPATAVHFANIATGNNASPAYIYCLKTRSTGTDANTVVQNGDQLFELGIQGSDGAAYQLAAQIKAFVDAAPGAADMPGRLEFLTTPDGSATPVLRMTIDRTGLVTLAGSLTIGSATLMTTTTSFTNGAGASAGTLTNAPAAGDPTKWIPVNDNGTTRYIPAW